jgi:hypothetical protein
MSHIGWTFLERPSASAWFDADSVDSQAATRAARSSELCARRLARFCRTWNARPVDEDRLHVSGGTAPGVGEGL